MLVGQNSSEGWFCFKKLSIRREKEEASCRGKHLDWQNKASVQT